MKMDPQAPKIKDNKENNHKKNASFGFNLTQLIDCEVYAQSKTLMIDNYFPTNSSPKGSQPPKKNYKGKTLLTTLNKEIKMLRFW